MRKALADNSARLESTARDVLDNASVESTATEILDAALHLLGEVLRTDCETRASALDLLTVDALITRALELAAADPETMETFPEQAMQRIAAIGESGETAARRNQMPSDAR